MRVLSGLTSLVALAASGVLALPTASPVVAEVADIIDRSANSVTSLSVSALNALVPYANFAAAAYCNVARWKCTACANIPGFQLTLSGGDGNSVQMYFVGYWPSQNAVVVAHEGTDPTQFLSDLTDLNILQQQPDTTLFKGIPSSVWVHGGFLEEHALTASPILAETQRLISTMGATQVITVGHSLGGALAELDSLFLTLNLPSSIHVKAVTFGTPRVGNPAYASYFDSKVSDFQRIDNLYDPIPIVPGRSLGYAHPHGEVHILGNNKAVACPGDDDASDSQCTISWVPNIFVSDLIDHLGPYQGVYVGTIFC